MTTLITACDAIYPAKVYLVCQQLTTRPSRVDLQIGRWLTKNKCLRSGSLNLNGMLVTCSLLGLSVELVVVDDVAGGEEKLA